MTCRAILLAALAGTILWTSATAGPAIATRWRVIGESRNDCLGHAQEAIKRAGFKMAEWGSQSAIGRSDQYTASIRCVTEEGIVFFVTAGPDAGEANRLLDVIFNVF